MKNKLVHYSIIGIFISLYFLVSTISMINSVDFFSLAHNEILSWCLAIGFEVGAAASLASLVILDKTNKNLVWGLFITLTLFQMMANSYHAFANLQDYSAWVELFGLEIYDEISQKRILSVISGAILPIVALGFIKSLVDYIKPSDKPKEEEEVHQKEIKVKPMIKNKVDDEKKENVDEKVQTQHIPKAPISKP